MNEARTTLMRMQQCLFENEGYKDRHVNNEMRRYLNTDLLPFLSRKLLQIPMLETRREQMGWEEPTRYSLVQIGAGFFMSGLYLVMMGSDTKDGDEAKAASFHLEKVFQKETSNCGRCGHKQCTGEVLCIDTPDTEQTRH
jgi:hypothetical protein